MTVKTRSYQVPEQTSTIAKKAFPKGCPLMTLRDHLGPIFDDQSFAHLFAKNGRNAVPPGILALVLVLQKMEDLSDRQAAHAAQSRIDWKYALGLDIDDPGFDFTDLSHFRDRLVGDSPELLLLDAIINKAKELSVFGKRDRARTDSTHVVANVRSMNRYELTYRAFEAMLEELARFDMEWVERHIPVGWEPKYSPDWVSIKIPRQKKEREKVFLVWGEDIRQVLDSIESDDPGHERSLLPAVRIMKRVWRENFTKEDGQIRILKKKSVQRR